MKKYLFYTCGILLSAVFSATAQSNQSLAEAGKTDQTSSRMHIFKPTNPLNDKTEQVDIIGMGVASFTTSNTEDGTLESYKHTQRVSINLIPAAGKTGTYQLIFYPESDQIPYVAKTDNGVLSIYYPLSLFIAIKGALEESFAAKKKVAVKVIEKTNGYREGTLIL